MTTDWSQLPQDLLLTILQKLNDVRAAINFSCACRPWGVIAQDYLSCYIPYGAPCLLIPGTSLTRDTKSKSRRLLAFPSGKNIDEVLNTLPQVMVPHLDLCCGSHHGWLALIKNNMTMYLFNPFSNRQINLPSVMTLRRPSMHEPSVLKKVMCKWYVNKIFLSTSPSNENSDCLALVIYGGYKELALYRIGDESWKFFCVIPQSSGSITDATYFEEQWNVLTDTGHIYRCGLYSSHATIIWSEYNLPRILSKPVSLERYIVESRGKLFQIIRYTSDMCLDDFDCREKDLHGKKEYDESISLHGDDEQFIDPYDYDNFLKRECCMLSYSRQTSYFKVYKLDTKNNETKPCWMQVYNLGGDAIFLGLVQSFSISNPRLYGYKENHIYFTEELNNQMRNSCLTGYDVGTFNLENSSIESLYESNALSMRPFAVWIIPKP